MDAMTSEERRALADFSIEMIRWLHAEWERHGVPGTSMDYVEIDGGVGGGSVRLRIGASVRRGPDDARARMTAYSTRTVTASGRAEPPRMLARELVTTLATQIVWQREEAAELPQNRRQGT